MIQSKCRLYSTICSSDVSLLLLDWAAVEYRSFHQVVTCWAAVRQNNPALRPSNLGGRWEEGMVCDSSHLDCQGETLEEQYTGR